MSQIVNTAAHRHDSFYFYRFYFSLPLALR